LNLSLMLLMMIPPQRYRAIVIDSESDPDDPDDACHLLLPEILGGVAKADCPSAHRRNRCNYSS
jgi:hypothetical protein